MKDEDAIKGPAQALFDRLRTLGFITKDIPKTFGLLSPSVQSVWVKELAGFVAGYEAERRKPVIVSEYREG